MSGGSIPTGAHDVMFASEDRIECRCGHESLTRFGHQSHLADVGAAPPADSNDPTEGALFDASRWTGTVLSGLIKSRSECSDCGAEWADDHECGGVR